MALPTVASVTSSLGSYPTVFYDRKAVKEFFSNLFLYYALEQKPMPDRSGVAMQIFGYTALAANTVAATDGTPQSAGVTPTASTGTINLSQYVDYISYSDKIVLTGISDVVTEGSELLAYRGALTVDTVISTAVDSAATADATTKIDLAHAAYVTASTIRKAAAQLRSVNAKPKPNGRYYGIMYSLMTFDVVNDSAAGGWQDMLKYTSSAEQKAGVNPGNQFIGSIGGVDLYESNSLPVVSNFQSTGINGYRAYIFAKDAFFGASLGKTQLGQKNFGVRTVRFAEGQNSLDPAAVIRAASVYNFFFGLAKRPQSVNGFRRITAESSIG